MDEITIPYLILYLAVAAVLIVIMYLVVVILREGLRKKPDPLEP